ncbi:MAG: tRNA lysidine(34) synthetase TilS [Acidimicrobiales bacterium]
MCPAPDDLRRRQVVIDLLARCDFPAAGSAVVCGVSGGADSLALLILAVAAELEVTAVHVDHGLRHGSESEADLVESVSRLVGAGFRSVSVAVDAGPNLEARARAVRHAALGSGALLGHTADDQAETILINLARGAGPEGLAAMVPGGRHPILALRRHETQQLCAELGVEPFDDPSNRDPRFVRNRIRHELLPLFDEIAGRDLVPLLVRTATHTRALVEGVAALADEVDVTSTAALRSASPVAARAALRAWLRTAEGHPPSTAELERVWDVVEHRVRACELAGGRRVVRSRARLALEEPEDVRRDDVPESGDGSVA